MKGNIYRYRVLGYIEVPSESGNTEYVGCGSAQFFCDTSNEAVNAVKSMMENFPACTYFTIARGEWR